jgi:hypothetical protein
MFHAINHWLARLLRQVLEFRLARDQAFAAAHGWHARQVKPGTWSYRDPRFIYRAFEMSGQTTGCDPCNDKVADWMYYSELTTDNRAGKSRRWW